MALECGVVEKGRETHTSSIRLLGLPPVDTDFLAYSDTGCYSDTFLASTGSMVKMTGYGDTLLTATLLTFPKGVTVSEEVCSWRIIFGLSSSNQ